MQGKGLKNGFKRHSIYFCFLLVPRPNYPTETTEEESVIEDDAELTLSKVEEEMIVGVPALFKGRMKCNVTS